VRLIENAAKRSDRDFVFPRHDHGICSLAQHAREFDMTSFLADFFETHGLEAALDLAKTEGLKPPQLPPEFDERLAGAWQQAARSAIPMLRGDSRALPLPYGPG